MTFSWKEHSILLGRSASDDLYMQLLKVLRKTCLECVSGNKDWFGMYHIFLPVGVTWLQKPVIESYSGESVNLKEYSLWAQL